MENKLEKIVSLAKRRGFVFPGSEIYGGLSGFYDFGHLGAELKFNIKQEWWNEVVRRRGDVVGLSSSIIMNPKVWEASGHLSGFSERLPEGRPFNLMFKTYVGPAEGSASLTYLRPETAAGVFVNFKNFLDTMRVEIPFGIAQIGRAFRNEINPKDFIFRIREFEQMELEYFVKPGEDEKYFNQWVDLRFKWYENLGLKNIRRREQPKGERAHYSKQTVDIEYEFPFGWKEIEGIANRGDFDLKAHSEHSGQDLSYTEDSGEKFIPYVIEPSAGPERLALAFLCEAYHEEKDRIVLKIHPKLAPYKVAVFPLLANKPELVEKAQKIFELIVTSNQLLGSVAWDDRGNIGKRYYSQDEIGTPWTITCDFQTLEDDTVTIRDRDTMKQERIKIGELKNYFQELLK